MKQEKEVCKEHEFVEEGTYTDCTVQVIKCAVCGEYSIVWHKNSNPPTIITKAEIDKMKILIDN